MAKEFNDVQLDVKFTQASSRTNLTSEENISVSFGKLSKWYADLNTIAWDGHPTYTAKSSGLYKITVDGTGHVSATTAASKSDIGLGNVENKSSATIRGELTKDNVTTALGYTPPTSDTNTTYTLTQDATDGHKITLTPSSGTATTIIIPDNDTVYTHPTYTSRTGKPTTNLTPGFGDTVTISQITSDSTGHVTAATDRTIKMPNTTMGAATADAAGTIGLVPAPAKGQQTYFLRGDGTWVVPTNTNTTYTLSGAASSATYVITLTPSSGTATTATVPAGTTSAYGLVKLSSATNSTSTALAATASAVKSAYDLASGKSVVSFSQSLTSGTAVGKITIDGTETTLYAPTNTNTTYTLSGAYGSSSNTWVTTLTPSSGTTTTSTVPTASTSVYGITKLSSSTSSTSTALAATASAVKSAYDLASGKSAVSFTASLTSGTKVGTITIDGTSTDLYCQTNTNTDVNVKQSTSSTANFRPLLSGYTNISGTPVGLDATVTNQAYVSTKFFVRTSTGEMFIGDDAANQLHILGGNYGFIIRNDGSSTYFLLTDPNTTDDTTKKYGSFNSLRPLYINNSTGIVTMKHGLTVNANVTATNFIGKLKQISSSRVASANLATSSSSSVQLLLSTNAMTTAKPSSDGYILNFDWDNNGNYQAQLFIPNNVKTGVYPQYRTQNSSSDWSGGSEWINFITSNNYTSFITPSSIGAAATDHTHNYAGSSSAGGAATSANKLNTDAGSATLPVYFSGGIPVATTAPKSGAWFSSFTGAISSAGVMEVGKIIDFHSTNAGTTDYDMRITVSSASLMTLTSNSGTPNLKLAGTLPRLRFQQTTSGVEYDNTNCGISAYPGGDTNGLMMTVQSGGVLLVGGGESPTNMYNRLITTDANPYGTTSFAAAEQMFVTSDNHIYFVSGANSVSASKYTDWTDLKTAIFDSSGNFRPSINNKGSIGTSSYKWTSMYATTFYGDLSGKVTVYAGPTVTSASAYGIAYFASAGTEETKTLYTNSVLRYHYLTGTADTPGTSSIYLGNAAASGTAGNSYGRLLLYSASTYYSIISASNSLTANRSILIPDYGGTMMVTGVGTALASGDDFDSVATGIVKHWYSASAAVSAAITNSPWTGGGYQVINVPQSSNSNYIKQFLLPNTERIPYIYRYRNTSWQAWKSPGTGFFFVKGTQTASTAAWTGNIDLPALYDGLTIAYYLPYASVASTNVTLTLTLSNGKTSGAINCYQNNVTRLTTHYGAGSTIILTYWSAGSISVGGDATTDDRWTRCDYNTNTNTAVTQNLITSNVNRPLLMSNYNVGTTTTSAAAVVRNDSIYANPSTATIYATNIELGHQYTVDGGRPGSLTIYGNSSVESSPYVTFKTETTGAGTPTHYNITIPFVNGTMCAETVVYEDITGTTGSVSFTSTKTPAYIKLFLVVGSEFVYGVTNVIDVDVTETTANGCGGFVGWATPGQSGVSTYMMYINFRVTVSGSTYTIGFANSGAWQIASTPASLYNIKIWCTKVIAFY